MRLTSFALGALSVLSLGGCAVEPPRAERASRTAQPIVDGQVDSGHPGVVALTTNGQPFCSGTLVTPTVVVTASHCIYPGIGVDPPTAIEVFFGTDVAQGGELVAVTEGQYNPAWHLQNPNADEDVAVLRLASAAPVAPIPMGKLPPPGSVVALIGFGITSAGGGGAGTKRIAHAPIDTWQANTFAMTVNPQGTCNGDSGGTALFDDGAGEKFVGIHTRSDCATFMLDERVDAHRASFIQPFIDAGATCGADLGCKKGCPSPDPDCPCAKDGFCTAGCADLATDPDCDPHCVADGACATDCPTPDPDCPVCVADGTCNDACSSDPDCVLGAGGSGGAGPIVGAGGGASGETPGTSGCGCVIEGSEGREPGGLALAALLVVGVRIGKRRARR